MKEKTKALREYLQSLTTKEMNAEQLEKHNNMISSLDEIDKDEDAYVKEIADCKDIIVSKIKSQGTSTPPKDEQDKKPRTLEEIARETLNAGGK